MDTRVYDEKWPKIKESLPVHRPFIPENLKKERKREENWTLEKRLANTQEASERVRLLNRKLLKTYLEGPHYSSIREAQIKEFKTFCSTKTDQWLKKRLTQLESDLTPPHKKADTIVVSGYLEMLVIEELLASKA